MKVKPVLILLVILLLPVTLFIFIKYLKVLEKGGEKKTSQSALIFSLPTPTATPTPTPTPKPLTFAEMNVLYGPCVYLPTLMYHHIEDIELAKKENHSSITVGTDFFRNQMQYLKDKGYLTVNFSDLINFFDTGGAIAKKSILLTFDDGYADFYLNALPILKEFGFKAAVFLPTGLVNNSGYLSWSQIAEASGAGIVFANHTWSHKSVGKDESVIQREITTADLQLSERGLNAPRVFAYPYGLANGFSEKILTELGYGLAFTTRSGATLCKKQRYALPRIRVGNSTLSLYGL